MNQVSQYINAKRAGASDAKALTGIDGSGMKPVLHKLYLDCGLNWGAREMTLLRQQKARRPIGFNELMTRLINEYFKNEVLQVVEDILQTTKKLIGDILTREYIKGSSFDTIVEYLMEKSFTSKRARVIARTETVTASNQGARSAASTTGAKYNKIWISAQDDRTRVQPRDKFDHLHMNGVTVGFDEFFNVSGEFMLHPGDRKSGATAGNICNCRCTHSHVAVRDASGRVVMN